MHFTMLTDVHLQESELILSSPWYHDCRTSKAVEKNFLKDDGVLFIP